MVVGLGFLGISVGFGIFYLGWISILATYVLGHGSMIIWMLRNSLFWYFD